MSQQPENEKKSPGGLSLDTPQLPIQPPALKPGEKPLFMQPEKAANSAYVQPPEEQPPIFDDELPEEPEKGSDDEPIENFPVPAAKAPTPGVRSRYIMVARLHALGWPPKRIAERLNYSDQRVVQLLKNSFVKAEIESYREKLFDMDITTALKDMGPDAIQAIHHALNSEREKPKDRAELAKWVLEKLTGKPKQEVGVESNTLTAFIDIMKSMQSRGESLEPTAIDVTPQEETSADAPPKDAVLTDEVDFSDWIKTNT